MLIEQIIKFELRGLGPLVVYVLLQLVIFMTKKLSKENLREDYYLLLKYCMRQCTLFSPTGAKSQNLTWKCKILDVSGLTL